MSKAYYNEIDPYAAQWLRNLIAADLIAPGDVDTRSIVDVKPDDLIGYTQCHFFAGIGGWSLAARLAGWPDDRELWTGSCPCQPFSVAGKGQGQADERHLWPIYFGLISARRPVVAMGEQVAAAAGKGWLDGVCADLETVGYSCGATVVPACAVNAPHRRDRMWFVADTKDFGPGERTDTGRHGTEDQQGRNDGLRSEPCGLGSVGSDVAHADNVHEQGEFTRFADTEEREGSFWGQVGSSGSVPGIEWATGADGKARRVKPGVRLLAHGVPARVGKLRAYGNAIVPQVAAEVIKAYMETCD